MSEQLPSDSLLSRVRTRIEMGIHVSLRPEQILALVECAEIVQTDYLLLSQDQQMKALQALKEFDL